MPTIRESSGYLIVYLYESKDSRKAVHMSRLVAASFLNPKGLDEREYIVRHIDGDRMNNSVRNLEIVPLGSNTHHDYQVNQGKTCEVEGCNQVAKTRGFCASHYSRWYQYGNPTSKPARPNGNSGASIPHGTTGGYSNHKCRCDLCRVTWNEYCAKKRQEARRLEGLADRHPSTEGRKCGCEECLRERSEMHRYNTIKRIHSSDREWLVRDQGGRCAICCEVPRRRLVVDHIHGTSLIRGLLCDKCNSGLGKLGDTIEGLERAIEYLRRPPVFDAE